MFVGFFHELSNDLAVDHNKSFSVNHRMLLIKEAHIFLLRDVHKSTDILTCLFVVCIYNSGFVRFLCEYMRSFGSPERIPNNMERNIADVFSCVLTKMPYNLLNGIIFV
jgi:hypothetical protein